MEPEKLLTSPDIDLNSDDLKNELGRWFSIYETLAETLSKPPYDICKRPTEVPIDCVMVTILKRWS